MRSVWLLALAASGCRAILGIDEPTVIDGGGDAPAFCASWHPALFTPCSLGAPMPALALAPGQYRYDTTTAGGTLFELRPGVAPTALRESALTLRLADDSEIAVLSVDSLGVAAGATLTVVGRKPLLVVSWSTIAITGAIDAGSHIVLTDAARHIAGTDMPGAGANVACGGNTGRTGDDANDLGGSGGGGGGGFQGTGGSGQLGGNPGAPGGTGGAPAPTPLLRGGCPGGTSGAAGTSAVQPASPGSRAVGGAGGGAIRLAAYDSIMVAGSINAGGAGGAGAPLNSACGGGGGGAGGYLGLEAPTVAILGALTANGGGGGGGGGANDFGNEGTDGKVDRTAAAGGPASTSGCGRPGGAGSVAALLDGTNAATRSACGGGGGGGGAAGFIFIASPAFTAGGSARISPREIATP